jgi:hypothetical protein
MNTTDGIAAAKAALHEIFPGREIEERGDPDGKGLRIGLLDPAGLDTPHLVGVTWELIRNTGSAEILLDHFNHHRLREEIALADTAIVWIGRNGLVPKEP